MRHTLERLRSEFLEMPGLRLTTAQIQRFCGIEPDLCRAVLDTLVEERFLELRPDGTYVKIGGDPKARPAVATLQTRDRARAS